MSFRPYVGFSVVMAQTALAILTAFFACSANHARKCRNSSVVGLAHVGQVRRLCA